SRYKNKADAQRELRRGSETGFVKITNENGKESYLGLPDGQPEGMAVNVSRAAAGVENLPQIAKSEDRCIMLSKSLQAVPDYDDFYKEVIEAGYEESDVDDAWREVCAEHTGHIDFAKAYEVFSKRRTENSGAWCHETGKRQYG